MKNIICCIFNVAPHYNAPIYKLMDEELDCNFYLGDKIHLPIKLMTYSDLNGYKETLKYKPIISNFYWLEGALNTLLIPYTDYILTGEVYCLSNWLILFYCMFTKKRTYLWTHGWYGNESFLKKSIKKFFFGMSSHILLYGDYARDLMIKEGFDKIKLSCIYNSLDYDKQIEIRSKLDKTKIYTNKFSNNFPVLFYIGRLQKNKRIDLLIDALSVLKQKSIGCNLVIIGEEAENTGIADKISDNKLNNHVWMYGACYDESKIGELIYNADICVCPGNVGLTAIHSLMYGTPVITHSNFCEQGPEFEAISDRVTGTFFKENDLQDLVDTIQSWLENKRHERDSIRLKCYEVVDAKYNPHVQIAILNKILSK